MPALDEREAERKKWEDERKLRDQKTLRRQARVRRIKDIAWSAVIASLITIIVVTSLGWLTTQSVVRMAREEGGKELVALRASICTVKFQQRPDAAARLVEFKALSYGQKDSAIKKFVTDEKLATMPGEDVPVPGAVDTCADAIGNLSR